MRSYADGRCADAGAEAGAEAAAVEAGLVSFRLLGCNVLFSVGGDSATWEILGDRATVDVGDPTPSLRENTLSARLSSPESNPESLVNVLARFEFLLAFAVDISTPDSEAASSSGGLTSMTL